jgi:hypothetical protein
MSAVGSRLKAKWRANWPVSAAAAPGTSGRRATPTASAPSTTEVVDRTPKRDQVNGILGAVGTQGYCEQRKS